MDNNEHLVSMILITFYGFKETYLCVGSVKDLNLSSTE